MQGSDRGCATNKTTANIELKAYEYLNYVRDTGRINYHANTKPNNANAARAARRNAASTAAPQPTPKAQQTPPSAPGKTGKERFGRSH